MVVGVVVAGGAVVGGLVVGGGLVAGGAVGGGEVGAGDVGAGCCAAVVGVIAGVDGARVVVVLAPAGAVVVGAAATGVAETFTTNHIPKTPCPAVEPGVLSPLKVYSGDPL
jgi:hypothetical protein